MLVVSLQGTYQKILKMMSQATASVDLFELRFDLCPEFSDVELKKITKHALKPLIFTLRSKEQGGMYPHAELHRYHRLYELLSYNPAYVDLEYHMDLDVVEKIKQSFPHVKIILSYHDFQKTPEDLYATYLKMRTFNADLYKLATYAHSSVDSLRMIEFVRFMHREKIPLCGMCMGEDGKITRILGNVFQNPLTYASFEEKKESAKGQLTYTELIQTYHFKNTNPSTLLYGLLGDPVSKSISDLSHNRIFQKFEENAIYVKMRSTKEQLFPLLSLLKNYALGGMSVTMPLKEEVEEYVQHLSPEAAAIGAINTLIWDGGEIWATNTDCLGAGDAIEERKKLQNQNVLILGAGGTAKALTYECIKRGAEVYIWNRTPEKAKQLAKKFQCHALDDLGGVSYDILINTTSVGMSPHMDLCPINPKDLLEKTLVFDAIFNPMETLLLQEARKKGCEIIYGYEMFIRQAIHQFRLWFEGKYDPKQMFQILEQSYLKRLGHQKVFASSS